jgi:hypothetical protein
VKGVRPLTCTYAWANASFGRTLLSGSTTFSVSGSLVAK